jgi:hypothetical protein
MEKSPWTNFLKFEQVFIMIARLLNLMMAYYFSFQFKLKCLFSDKKHMKSQYAMI